MGLKMWTGLRGSEYGLIMGFLNYGDKHTETAISVSLQINSGMIWMMEDDQR
jgi:hypothetical protein